MDKTAIHAIHAEELARTKNELHAWQGTRTRVHEALQNEVAPPKGVHGDHPDVTHERQKQHFRSLWERTDELVKAAGVTEAGRAS